MLSCFYLFITKNNENYSEFEFSRTDSYISHTNNGRKNLKKDDEGNI